MRSALGSGSRVRSQVRNVRPALPCWRTLRVTSSSTMSTPIYISTADAMAEAQLKSPQGASSSVLVPSSVRRFTKSGTSIDPRSRVEPGPETDSALPQAFSRKIRSKTRRCRRRVARNQKGRLGINMYRMPNRWLSSKLDPTGTTAWAERCGCGRPHIRRENRLDENPHFLQFAHLVADLGGAFEVEVFGGVFHFLC